jgi:hypothetical protein
LSTIGDLSSTTALTPADQLPIWSEANKATRKITVATLAAQIATDLQATLEGKASVADLDALQASLGTAATADTGTTEGTVPLLGAGGKFDAAMIPAFGAAVWGDVTGTISNQTDLQTALAAKAPLSNPTFTGTVSGITKAMVGLGSADNTSDANKPVSTAQQTALDLKANIASPTFTGTPLAPTAAAATSTTQIATTAFVTTADNLKANIASPTFTGTPAAPTATGGTKTTQLATTAFVNTPAIQSVTSSATVTPTFANDQVNITAQAVGLTLANWSGTAQDGWAIAIRIKDNGTARAISYGTQYRAIGVTLPTTTVISKTLYICGVWNAADSKIDVLAVAQEA